MPFCFHLFSSPLLEMSSLPMLIFRSAFPYNFRFLLNIASLIPSLHSQELWALNFTLKLCRSDNLSLLPLILFSPHMGQPQFST